MKMGINSFIQEANVKMGLILHTEDNQEDGFYLSQTREKHDNGSNFFIQGKHEEGCNAFIQEINMKIGLTIDRFMCHSK